MSPTFQRMTKQWYTLRAGVPGMRFRRLLENRCRERGLLCDAWRNRMLAIALVLCVAGLTAMSVSSLCGVSIVAVSLVLVGRESLRVAEWLDLADARRTQWRRDRRQFRR